MLFSSGRKVLYGSLPLDEFGTSFCFPQGGKSSICIVRCCSTSLERRAVFLGEESLLFESFVATRRVWNVVPFSSGRKNIVCLSALNWTSCLISRLSTNLERGAVSQGKIFFYLYCFNIVARRIWNVVPFSSGRKNIVCLSALNWTSCLISRLSTNLERGAVSQGKIFFYLYCFNIVARRIWNVVPFSSGRKLTLFALTARLDIV